MVGCGSKNKHQKDMCSKETRLHAQNLLTIPMVNSQHSWGNHITKKKSRLR